MQEYVDRLVRTLRFEDYMCEFNKVGGCAKLSGISDFLIAVRYDAQREAAYGPAREQPRIRRVHSRATRTRDRAVADRRCARGSQRLPARCGWRSGPAVFSGRGRDEARRRACR